MNIVDIPEFDKADIANQTFREIFEMYDNNFGKLYELLKLVSTNFLVEKFTGATNTTLTLARHYVPGSNQLLVYKNNALQWEGEGFTETSSNTILMADPVEFTDDIRVIMADFINPTNPDNPNMDLTIEVAEIKRSVTALNNVVNEINRQMLAGDYDKMVNITDRVLELERLSGDYNARIADLEGKVVVVNGE